MSSRYYYLMLAVIPVQWMSCGTSRSAPKPEAPLVREDKPSLTAVEDDGLVTLESFPPYFNDLEGNEALTALAENRAAEAISFFDDIASNTSDIVLTPRARFMAAYLSVSTGRYERALKELVRLAEELPLIADLALERAAYSAYNLKSYDEAIGLADQVDDESTLAANASMIRADALRAKGELRGALEAYQLYLDNWSGSARRQEAEYRIVECMACLLSRAELGEEEAKEAILRIDRQRAQSPEGYWTKRAEAHENAFMAVLGMEREQMPPARRAAEKAFEEASELKRQMKNELAEKAFQKAVSLSRHNAELRCKAVFEQAVVVANQRQYERAADLFVGVSKDCDDPNLRIRSLYRGAKAYCSAGKNKEAVQCFAAVEAEFPSHSYADDARLRAAKCHLGMGDRRTAQEMLRSLPDLYPNGDMRAEALWLLAEDAISNGAYLEAKEALEKYYGLFPNEKSWYASGRSGYWLGRVEEILGDMEPALSHYEHVIASSPLTFYMVLAYNRLAALRPGRAEEILEKVAPKRGDKKVRFHKSLLASHRHLEIGIELFRLGLFDEARRELKQLLKTPDLPAEANWIVASIQRQIGDFAEAKEVSAMGDTSWQNRYPVDQDLVPWTLAFPIVYEDEVLDASKRNEIDSHMIWAVMREESGFNPRIESWANAIGLMQLILPTARSVGKTLGISVNRKNLKTPSVNIPIGAAHLARLEGLFGGHPALAIAAYNAGEGALARWLKDIPSKDIDMFVERIPYEQTRGYTKRVISSYATYLFLYGDERTVLTLPLILPS